MSKQSGPPIGSWWLYAERESISPFGTIILEVQKWERLDGGAGTIDFHYFTLRGISSGNLFDHPSEIPPRLMRVSLEQFWDMVHRDELRWLSDALENPAESGHATQQSH